MEAERVLAKTWKGRAAVVLALLAFCLSHFAFSDELSVAREALRDGLWEVARNHAGAVTNAALGEARLVILESYAGEGKWDAIANVLAGWKDAKGDGFDYYRAIVKGDHAAAMAVLRRVGSPEGLIEAKMFEADALAKDGNRDAANGIWREVASATNVSERVFATACANLMDVKLLRKAYADVRSARLRRLVGLRLGTVLLREPASAEEGEKLVRAIVKDSPDAEGAREAFLAVADAEVAAGQWKTAADTYHAAIETWPDVAKIAAVQEGRGWVFRNLGRRDEAIEAFKRAGELATDDEGRAVAAVKVGDLLQEMGKGEEAMSCYRDVLAKFPETKAAKGLVEVVKLRELEAKGRDFFRNYRFDEAMAAFDEVARLDSTRRDRMSYYGMLCLYGQGRDDEAGERAARLAAECPDLAVRAESMLWLAKFLYNRREWKESCRWFVAHSEMQVPAEAAAESLLWAARAAAAENDFNQVIALSTRIAERFADAKAKNQALLVQGEALIELARFDEAVLIFERVATAEGVVSADRIRAQMLRADALYAMGADNSSRYVAALEAYRAVRFGGVLSPSEQVVVSYKIARALEKLKRVDEAMDQYYTQVMLAYRTGRIAGERFSDDAKAAFSKAAFRLADEYESRGRDRQAASVLQLVVESDVPAAGEAAKRIDRIANRGSML